ncbi:ABC transporter permease [Nemorincola caseinilytica]
MQKQKGAFSAFIIRLAIGATALSVTVMIMALAIVTGFSHAISEKLFSFMGHVHVALYNETGAVSGGLAQPIYLDPKLLAELRSIPQVASVSPYVVTPAIVQAKGQLEGLNLKGVDDSYHFLGGITSYGARIDHSDTQYSKDIILSKATAEKLDVSIGDTIQINFIDQSTPRIRRVRVCGLYHSGMEEVDKHFAVCDMRLLQRVNNWDKDSINGYQLDLTNAADADSVTTYIHYNLIDPPLAVNTTAGTYTFIFDWLRLQGSNSAILIIIMAIVAIINLGAALLILIIDRAVMIGLLSALGMTFERTRDIFLYIAAIIGGAGILLGNILALTLCLLQARYGFMKLPESSYSMKYVPVKVIWWQIALVDVLTLLICVLCMWLPTLYIRRVQPAKVLQFK